MLIPRMILCHLRGGSSGLKQAHSNFKDFLDFRWEQLLSRGSMSSSRDFCSSDASNQHQAALRLVRCGEISRDGKLLVSRGLAPVSAEVADKLASKHIARVKAIPTPSKFCEPITLSRSAFLATVAKLPRGFGCEPAWWKCEHLRALSGNSVIADSFFSVCNLIAKGSFPSSVSGVLSGSRLIALPKTGGDVRPIAIGECLRCVTAKVICRQKRRLLPLILSLFNME